MTPRLSGHFSIFGLVFFVFKSLLGIARQWSREKFAILTLKPRSHVRILIYRAWAIRQKSEGNWAELTFRKTSGTVTGDRESDLRVSRNDPISNCRGISGPVSF